MGISTSSARMIAESETRRRTYVPYLALSHYHYDHTANANEFAGAIWLVRQAGRDAMFAEKPPGVTQPSTYAALRNSKTLILKSDERDVFGDGTVVIKSAPGHTPGHQVLYVKLQDWRCCVIR
jgi:glyoxylase-like metal-dependent hydrolase (beta-lactamase superfamily II)